MRRFGQRRRGESSIEYPGYRLLVGSFRASEKLFRYAACEWCQGREELRANDGKHRGRRYLHL